MPLPRRARPLLVPVIVLAVFAATALVPAAALALLPSSLVLDETAHQELRQVETYFNGIRTMQARFVQTSSNGQRATGRVFMSRPGKLRVESIRRLRCSSSPTERSSSTMTAPSIR